MRNKGGEYAFVQQNKEVKKHKILSHNKNYFNNM